MSDYIETLSMSSSHSSSDNQSIRGQEGDPCAPCTKSRPRTGKDYHIIDRGTILHQEGAPPPSSPRLNQTQTFILPKEPKEINYLEVDRESLENGPPSPAIKPEDATQYAVIDVVATKAANRIGDERERERKLSFSSQVSCLKAESNPSSPKLKHAHK